MTVHSPVFVLSVPHNGRLHAYPFVIDEALTRETLPAGVVELADDLLARLGLSTPRGRVELSYKDGRLVELRRHEVFHRSELAALDMLADEVDGIGGA